MCSFNVGKNSPKIGADDIMRQFDSIYSQLVGQEAIGVFPYSALDLQEFPFAVWEYLASRFKTIPSLRYVLLEATAELVNDRTIDRIVNLLSAYKLVTFLGVETSSDFIRHYCVNKSFTWERVVKAVQRLHAYGLLAYAFLLFKPPFLEEGEAIADALQSVQDCLASGFDGVSIRGVEIHKYALTEILHDVGLYRGFSLLSLVTFMENVPENCVGKTSISSLTESKLSAQNVGNNTEISQADKDMVRKAVEAFNRPNFRPSHGKSLNTNWAAGSEEIVKRLEQRLREQYKIALTELRRRTDGQVVAEKYDLS
jgi:radical SAM enzyme (TIGR01210 family)